MKKIILTLLIFGTTLSSFAQYRVNAGASIGADAAMFSIGAEREFNVINEKFHINPGVRLSVYNGSNLDYITAPAKYTVNDNQVDTLRFKTVQDNFANLYVRIGYDVSDKFSVSFDIDVVGVSFGGEQKNNVFSSGTELTANPPTGGIATQSNAKPTSLNVLLVGDNDLGSLNSTLNISYDITKRLGVDLGGGLIFTEYTANSEIGYDANDRFRNKNFMGYLGISYLIGDK
ncbi:MAG: hypothetical protein COA58_03840 [Bacteroidetes bacterium]|nr:MAG: hypothetical protein COA58_03840 [Bacteroidota bacterium]